MKFLKGNTPAKHLQWLLKIGQQSTPQPATLQGEFAWFLGLDGRSSLPEVSLLDQWIQEIQDLIHAFQKGHVWQVKFGPLTYECRFRGNGTFILEKTQDNLNSLFYGKILSLRKEFGPRIWKCPLPPATHSFYGQEAKSIARILVERSIGFRTIER